MDDRAHVLTHVAHFGVLGCLDADERRVRQLGQPPCDFGLAAACRALDQQVFRCDFGLQIARQVLSSPSVPEGAGDGLFGLVLADDEPIQVLHQFLRSEGGLVVLESLEDLLQLGLFILATEAGLRVAVEEEVPGLVGEQAESGEFPEVQHG